MPPDISLDSTHVMSQASLHHVAIVVLSTTGWRNVQTLPSQLDMVVVVLHGLLDVAVLVAVTAVAVPEAEEAMSQIGPSD